MKPGKDPLDFNLNTVKIDFFKTIDFSKYDIVHSHGFLADMYVSIHRNKKCKWISTLHQKIKPNYSLDYNVLIAGVLEYCWLTGLKRADHIVTLTDDMRAYYQPKLKRTPISYIYNGIPGKVAQLTIADEELSKIQGLKMNSKLIGISARLVYLKGIDQVIKVLALNNKYSLMIIGDGEERDNLLALAKDLNVDSRILFLGYKSNPRDYLKLCDVYAMSSRTEGFGLCVIEAASQKVPVVCSDLPVYREIFTDEVVRYEVEDIDSLDRALNYAIENHDLLANKVYNKYINSFTSKIMAERYFELYQNISC